MSLALDETEIEKRLLVWSALSDLFLDTDIDPLIPGIARIIAQSGYSIDATEEILRWEVRPAFYWNLLDVAGEWAGWPDALVRERILSRRSWLDRAIIGEKRFMPEEWPAVAAEVVRLRAR